MLVKKIHKKNFRPNDPIFLACVSGNNNIIFLGLSTVESPGGMQFYSKPHNEYLVQSTNTTGPRACEKMNENNRLIAYRRK
jgi:hypothetical protein